MNKNQTLLSFKLGLVAFVILANHVAMAQDDLGVTRWDCNRRPKQREHLNVPAIPGFITLKADLHMHTVFSDGMVWPTIRVQEAWQEGLDVISITDHIEYQPHRNDVPTQHNRPFELAKESADRSNIILIRGSEITRDTPPGHFNAIFIEDASGFVETRGTDELDQEAIDRAVSQKAFVFWNHPGWKAATIEGSYEWIPFVEGLLKDGKLHGIEVFNGFGFHRKALDWCIEHKLAVLGTSDIHNLIAHEYDLKAGKTRTMTLLFVKERTEAGVREALNHARSIAWASGSLAGPEELLRALFEASVAVSTVYHTDDKGIDYVEVHNKSSIPFVMEQDQVDSPLPKRLELNPHSTRMLSGADLQSHLRNTQYRVTNAFIRSDRHLEIKLDRSAE